MILETSTTPTRESSMIADIHCFKAELDVVMLNRKGVMCCTILSIVVTLFMSYQNWHPMLGF